MTEREHFEDYKRKQNPCVRLARQSEAVGGSYRTVSVQRDWQLWQASRRQALQDAMAECNRQADHETDMGRTKEAFGCDLCVESLSYMAHAVGQS